MQGDSRNIQPGRLNPQRPTVAVAKTPTRSKTGIPREQVRVTQILAYTRKKHCLRSSAVLRGRSFPPQHPFVSYANERRGVVFRLASLEDLIEALSCLLGSYRFCAASAADDVFANAKELARGILGSAQLIHQHFSVHLLRGGKGGGTGADVP